MNINKLNHGPNDSPQSPNKSPVDTKLHSNKDSDSKVTPADQVKLSASGRSIQQIESDIKSMPDVNDVTIDRIRNAIASGEYKVDYQRLAGKMLQFDQMLK